MSEKTRQIYCANRAPTEEYVPLLDTTAEQEHYHAYCEGQRRRAELREADLRLQRAIKEV